MSALDVDRDDMGRFVNGMFMNADKGTYVSLRTFTHNAADPPFEIRGVEINGEGLGPVIGQAVGAANRAARYRQKSLVFAPPVCTLNNARRAREEDLANGLALSVEIDANAQAGLALLRGLVGTPTAVVASGGEWTNPTTGEVQPKLHGHWRLSEPTRSAEDHTRLKRARRLATALIGGDHTNIPVVHPIRWPGSWHRKGEPKLARITEFNEGAEIHLGDALGALEAAAAAHGIDINGTANGGSGGQGEARETADLILEITSARGYVAPLVALSARFAGGGMTRPKIIEFLQGLMLSVPHDIRDGGQSGRWQSRFDGIPRMAASAVAKYGSDASATVDEAEVAKRLDGTDAPAVAWPEPIDILADPKLTGIATVDVDCLPASMLALAVAEGARLQVDPSHIAALTIGVCSAVISDNWRVLLKVNDTEWTQHPAIWVAVVAESGRRKTDCFKSAMRGVTKVEQKLRLENNKKLAKYVKEREAWEALPKKERGPEPKAPVEPRLATDDFTIDGLGELLQHANKILLRSDELATVLGAFDRFAKPGAVNANRAHMLGLYDGGPRRIDRVQRGKMFVENWSAVPVGHIQPAKVRELVSGLSDDGLLQRFMLVMPPRLEVADPDNDDVTSDRRAIDAFADIVEALYHLRPTELMGVNEKPEYALVEAGHDVHEVRRRLFRLIERIEVDLTLAEPLKQATSKWRGLLARLSLVFHCVELAEAELYGVPPDPITKRTLKASTVERACNFIMRVVVPSTFRFHTEVGTSGGQESHARWVAGYILSRKVAALTARDIGRAYREIRGQKAEIAMTMDTLDHAGWVRPDPNKPKDTAWLVNPRVHECFAERAEAEKARRDATRELIKASIAELAK